MSEEDPYVSQAKVLIDDVIEKAIRRLETDLSLMSERERTFESLKVSELSRESTIAREDDYVIDDITWLSIGEFSVELAQKKLDEFVKQTRNLSVRTLVRELLYRAPDKTWKYDDSWQYCIDYLGQDDLEFDIRHRLRVRWSVPTRRKPVPRATACVYFTFSVSKIKPKNHPVDVYYVFETNRLVHRPGQSRFREKWLKDVIESKVIMMETVAF